jgi:membrane dipeptidase
MKIKTLLGAALLLIGILSSCTHWREGRAQKANLARARQILAATPIVDTHIDFPWSLVERREWFMPGYTALALRHPGGDFDFERAVQGGLYGAFMSIYIPAVYQQQEGRSRQVADSLILAVEQVAAAHPARFTLAYRAADVMSAFKQGKVALPMGMENGSPVDKIEDVAYFHKKGIRYITLTHSRNNKICDSSYDTTRTHGGLSTFGREVVREMNRVGIMVDVSHLSDASIVDVLEVANKPLLASHSACRHFTPGFIRNLPDSLIVAIAKTNGVIQVPFSHYFLTANSRTEFQAAEKKLTAKGFDEQSPEARFFMRKELVKNTVTNVKTVADQIDYIVRLVGINHVGIGSDFDGVGLALPPDLADVSMYPNLLAELLRRGYSDADIRKICSENLLRVWKANE